MEIRWLGHSSFLITDSKGFSILTDPYDKYVGKFFPFVSANIVITSHKHKDHSAVCEVQKYDKHIDNECDYCYNGIKLKTFLRNHDDKGGVLRGKTLITKLNIDNITLCHMGDIGEDCTDELVALIGNIDVLMIPVGGTYTIDAHEAKKYIEKIKPKIVIPMHYKNKYCVFDIDKVDSFVSLFDKSICKNVQDTTLYITKEMLNSYDLNIILLRNA